MSTMSTHFNFNPGTFSLEALPTRRKKMLKVMFSFLDLYIFVLFALFQLHFIESFFDSICIYFCIFVDENSEQKN